MGDKGMPKYWRMVTIQALIGIYTWQEREKNMSVGVALPMPPSTSPSL